MLWIGSKSCDFPSLVKDYSLYALYNVIHAILLFHFCTPLQILLLSLISSWKKLFHHNSNKTWRKFFKGIFKLERKRKWDEIYNENSVNSYNRNNIVSLKYQLKSVQKKVQKVIGLKITVNILVKHLVAQLIW